MNAIKPKLPNNFHYDFIGSINRNWDRIYQRNGGILDELTLISDCYQILFVNYFATRYVIEPLDEMKDMPKVYRHQSKVSIKGAIEYIEKYTLDIEELFGKESNLDFISMNDGLWFAFKHDVDELEKAMADALSKKDCSKCIIPFDTLVKFNVAIMLVQYANENITERIKEDCNTNPIITQIEWTRPIKLLLCLQQIVNLQKTPLDDGSIKVYSKWMKFQKKWRDNKFISENMGVNVPVDSVNGEDFKTELNEVFTKAEHLSSTEAHDRIAQRNMSRIFAGMDARQVQQLTQ